jgi:molecular chaperone GrpE
MNQDQDQPAPDETKPVRREIDPSALADLERRAAQADEFREQMLRARADYANLLKRQTRESEEARKYALAGFVKDLLPALDDLRKFLHAAQAGEQDFGVMRQAVEMAVAKLDRALAEAGVTAVPAAGRPFDPAVHEAVDVHHAPDVAQPTVAAELRAGYRLHDRLLRAAQVRVAMPPKSGQAKPAPGPDTPMSDQGEE